MNHEAKHPHPRQTLQGEFRYPIFSPKGAVEGLMLQSEGKPLQLVVEPDRGDSLPLASLRPGQQLAFEAEPPKPSPKGKPAHRLLRLHRLLSMDGHAAAAGDAPQTVSGTVVRFNFARHGEPNGVVLDSGDFIHCRPQGMKALSPGIGDKLTATGPARSLAGTTGKVVEARRINGRDLA
jgi:hypothetical protein